MPPLDPAAEFVALVAEIGSAYLAWADQESKGHCRAADGRFSSCRGGKPSRSHQNPVKVRGPEHADWLKHQHTERREHASDIRSERRTLRREHGKERVAQRREHERDTARLTRSHGRETERMESRHGREAGRAKDPAATAERHASERSDLAASHATAHGDLRATQHTERQDLRSEHREARQDQRREHLEGIRDVRASQRTEMTEALRGVREERNLAREERGHKASMARIAVKDSPPLQDPPGNGEADDDAENTYNLPDGEDIEAALKRFFAQQAHEVLGTIPTIGEPLPDGYEAPDLGHYDERMQRAMTPLISAYWDEAGHQIRAKIGLEPDAWPTSWMVTDPHVRAKISNAAMAFCASTNATTTLQLDHAISSLKHQLTEGLVDKGEGVAQLTKRVQSVFETASKSRARRIAATEASRAQHQAQYTSVEDSDVVAGLKILISANSCDFCKRLASQVKQVPLGQNIAVVGDHPDYKDIKAPPFHPMCRCSCLWVLTPEYGGPESPEWGETLDQPDTSEDYRPPSGTAIAEPEPDAEQPVAVAR